MPRHAIEHDGLLDFMGPSMNLPKKLAVRLAPLRTLLQRPTAIAGIASSRLATVLLETQSIRRYPRSGWPSSMIANGRPLTLIMIARVMLLSAPLVPT